MIKFSFNKEKNKVKVYVYLENKTDFDFSVSIFFKYGYKFDRDIKRWVGSPAVYDELYNELDEIEPVEIHPYVESLIREAQNVPIKIKKFRDTFDYSLLNYPPLKGKPPYENFQVEDITKLLRLNRGACYWWMGLGKSFVISYLISHFFVEGKIDKILIIVPPDGLLNLKREIIKFSPLFKEDDFHISTSDNKELFHRDYKIILMTYTAFISINNFYYIQKFLLGKRKTNNGKLVPLSKSEIRGAIPKRFKTQVIDFKNWGTNRMIILDESHLISNPKSITSHYLHLYKDLFEYRYIFSGTPADKYEKYYSQIKFLDTSLIPKKYNEWKHEIAVVGTKFSTTAISEYKIDKVNEFLEKISPYVVRRLAKDVLDLPPDYIKKSYVAMSEKQTNIYRGLVNATLYKISEDYGKINLKQVFNKFPYIIQAIDNPCLLQGKLNTENNEFEFLDSLIDLIDRWKFKDHPKLQITDYLLDLYIKKEKRKVILWSYHPMSIDQLSEYYKKYKPVILHGQMKDFSKDRVGIRDAIVEDFKADPNKKLFIASFKVLNKAKTITEVSRQIYFDRNFSYTDYVQSMQRIYRYGTTECVKTHVLLMENSIDIHLDRVLEQKEDVDKILANKKYLTKKELKDVFEGRKILK